MVADQEHQEGRDRGEDRPADEEVDHDRRGSPVKSDRGTNLRILDLGVDGGEASRGPESSRDNETLARLMRESVVPEESWIFDAILTGFRSGTDWRPRVRTSAGAGGGSR